ncbi:MAG: hypothetical protein HDT42_13180 [Ruminococcaceae bacterium]|nr:hypothetical protein [Oscillospiraceae bacterium]
MNEQKTDFYEGVSRAEFERRKDLVAQIMCELGCEPVKIELNYIQKTTSITGEYHRSWISDRPLYKFTNGYYRIDEVLFPEKPFIVLEYADTVDKVIKNIMEDCDPFPYDLSDADITKEVKYSLGIEPCLRN